MKVLIEKGKAFGTVTAPPSKSYAHRMMICAALASGRSVIRGVSESEDMLATLDCISALGAKYVRDGDTVCIDGVAVSDGEIKKYRCRESGSTFRFFIPVAMLFGKASEFYGSERLMERGAAVYKDVFANRDVSFVQTAEKLTVSGTLESGNYTVDASISSQFISGLLFALPLADGDSTITLIPPVESKNYIDITVDVLSKFGIEILYEGNTLKIKGRQKYIPQDVTVEGDASNAAFLDALNFVGGNVTVKGLERESKQGDSVYNECFAKLKSGKEVIDLKDTPDLAPMLFALAASENGGVFTGTRRLRIKESDRAAVMAEELAKLGVCVTVEENSVSVDPRGFGKPTVTLDGHNDHRIVMSLAVLLTLFGGVIDGAQAVRKSYPNFFDDLRKLGITVKEID